MTVAFGFFDGVHLGHRAILAGVDRVITFNAHPLVVLAPERAPRLIMSRDARLAAIRACGVGDIVALDFTRDFAALPPAEFARRYLADATAVRCGANARFGAGGKGDADFLRAQGLAVTVVPYAVHGGEPVSSSRIRAALEAGALEDANAMLGRAFTVSGSVVSGKGLGTKLGFPTVNLVPDSLELRLPHGVYAVEVAGVRAIANFGFAPTLGADAWRTPTLEIHFPSPRTPALPHSRTSALLHFLRPERTFASLDALRAQIREDIRRADF